jgi:hypothetical protein
MSEAAADRLRSLVRDYQQGRLSFPEYRRLRAALLDSLGREPGEEVVAAKLIAEVITQPRPASPVVVRPGGVGTRKSTPWSRRQWVGALVLGLVAVTIGAMLLLNRSAERSGAAVSRGPVSSDRIYDVIEPLMNNPDWGEARIAAVNASLLEEGARQIAARQQTEWFQRFAAEVRQRLQSQRAAGAEGLMPDKSSLAALAVTIGLNLQDLDAPLMPPPRGGPDSTGRLPDPH